MNRPPREKGLFVAAVWRLALAGAVFVVVYSFCNRFTAERTDVGVWMWEWERHIPFVPELVVPYWSLDLFFCGAFFLCGSRVELNLLTKRLVAVTLASGVCYLIFPLTMGFPRPEPSGWTAPLFRALYFNDLPHNLAPSLHISLRSLVWIVYGAWLRGWLRQVAKGWFILIGISTLLVWQHHLIDVATGFLMGWMVAALIPDPRQPGWRTPSARLARRYGLGAAACAGLSVGWFLFAWPAVAVGIVSVAYAMGRPRLLGKENGTLSPAAEWCLLPVMLGTWWIQRKWLRSQPPWRQVGPGVWYGRRPTAAEAREWVEQGPSAVLDLTAEGNALRVFPEQTVFLNLPMLDLVRPDPRAVAEALKFIREHQPQRRVLIHCQLGLQRSATVAAHWLAAGDGASGLKDAQRKIQDQNPMVVFHADDRNDPVIPNAGQEQEREEEPALVEDENKKGSTGFPFLGG